MNSTTLVMTPHIGVELSIYECEACVDRLEFPNDTIAKEQTDARVFSFMRDELAKLGVDRFIYTTRELGDDLHVLRLRGSVLVDHAHQP